jgi:hypothetical protein
MINFKASEIPNKILEQDLKMQLEIVFIRKKYVSMLHGVI